MTVQWYIKNGSFFADIYNPESKYIESRRFDSQKELNKHVADLKKKHKVIFVQL
jgi:hypothetical protein